MPALDPVGLRSPALGRKPLEAVAGEHRHLGGYPKIYFWFERGHSVIAKGTLMS